MKIQSQNIVQRYGLKSDLRFALPKYQGQGQFDEMTPISGENSMKTLKLNP